MFYLSDRFIDNVYDTLQGCLVPEARIAGVKNLFANGSACDAAYSGMYDAYMRLLSRLNKEDEDHDVEIIIDSLLHISRLLGKEMYLCGAKFASQQ